MIDVPEPLRTLLTLALGAAAIVAILLAALAALIVGQQLAKEVRGARSRFRAWQWNREMDRRIAAASAATEARRAAP
jgi:hypothetical protein